MKLFNSQNLLGELVYVAVIANGGTLTSIVVAIAVVAMPKIHTNREICEANKLVYGIHVCTQSTITCHAQSASNMISDEQIHAKTVGVRKWNEPCLFDAFLVLGISIDIVMRNSNVYFMRVPIVNEEERKKGERTGQQNGKTRASIQYPARMDDSIMLLGFCVALYTKARHVLRASITLCNKQSILFRISHFDRNRCFSQCGRTVKCAMLFLRNVGPLKIQNPFQYINI